MGVPQRGIEVGAPAELLALSVDDPRTTPDEAMDDFVFARRATRLLADDARR
jgi:cytosine/adenosine deaminase-related metal-dependent hydrolase